MFSKYYLALVILFVWIFPQCVSAQLPPLSSETIEDYQLAIEPTETGSAFLRINWYSQLRQAVREARHSEKPLLIYMMNGHPLACT